MADDKKTSTKKLSFYDQIHLEAKKQGIRRASKASIRWYRSQIEALGTSVTPRQALAAGRKFDTSYGGIGIGSMFFYHYDPKWKMKLPYYDTFPLTIVIHRYDDGFLGLNLHYLDPETRGRFLSKLMDVTTNSSLSNEAKFKVTYQLLSRYSKYKDFKPCLHRYLYSHLRSVPTRVLPQNWMMAVFLPVARFKYNRSGAK